MFSESSTAGRGSLNSQKPKRLAHKICSPHQRFGPPGEVMLNPEAVPTRALARATRDKRANSMFLVGNKLRRARASERRGGRNTMTRGRGTETPQLFGSPHPRPTPPHTPRRPSTKHTQLGLYSRSHAARSGTRRSFPRDARSVGRLVERTKVSLKAWRHRINWGDI